MVHFTRILLLLLFFGSIKPVFSQSSGDFRSKSSGNWGDYTTWQVYNGASWNDATSGQYPGGTSESNATNVYIEAGHTVTLQSNQSCKDLHLNTTSDVVRINTQDNILDVWGKMRFYEGTAPGSGTPTSVTSSGITGWITTGSNGYIRFRGTADRIIMDDGQVNSNNSNSGWNLDFAFDTGFTGQVKERIRAGNITVSSGTLFVNDPYGELRIGTNNGSGDATMNGQFLIKSGATVTGGTGIFKKANTAAESITIESGGTLEITASGYVLAAQTLDLSGSVILRNGINFPTEAGRSGASQVNTFTNLTLAGTGAKTLQNNITVNGTLSMADSATLSLSTFALSYGPSASLEYNGSTSQTSSDAEFPLSNGPANLIINNSNGVTLHEPRTITNQITLTSGLLYLGNSDLTIGESGSAIAGTPSSSSMIVTDGTGKLIKVFSTAGTFLFPIGDTTATDEYSNVQLTINSANTLDATTYFALRVINSQHPEAAGTTDYLSRHWEIATNMVGYSYNASFQYLAADVTGTEANLNSVIFSDETSGASRTLINSVNSSTHQINITNEALVGFISGVNFGCNISNNTITAPATTIFCNSASSIFIDGAAASVSSGSPTYQWQQRVNLGSWSNIASNSQSEDYTELSLSSGTYEYRRLVSDPNYCIYSDTSNTITITVTPSISGNTIGNNQTITFLDDPAAFTTVGSVTGGTGTYTYQWKKSTTQGGPYSSISGASSETYDLAAQSIYKTSYFVRDISSGVCSSSSNEIVLNLLCGITLNPTDVSTCADNTINFSAGGAGAGITYQWQGSFDGGVNFYNLKNGTLYSNVTTSTLTLTSVPTSLNNYKFRCKITGTCSTNYTTAALLAVTTPAISSQPSNSTICSGNNTSFNVTATGSGILYQWQVSANGGSTFSDLSDGGVYSNTTTANLNITAATVSMNNYQYRCVVSGGCNSVLNSNAATLNVNQSTTVSGPSDQSICAGSNASFSVSAIGGSLTYQWQGSFDGGVNFYNLQNGSLYSNVTTSILTITSVPTTLNNYKFRCKITNTCGTSYSTSALLSILSPIISSQPSNSTICSGNNTSFSITTSGSGISYQWKVSTDGGNNFSNLSDGGVYSNTTTATLGITGATTLMNNYKYQCELISTGCSNITSNTVTLTVNQSTSVTSNPSDVSTCTGSNTSFSISATGTNLSYQWQASLNGGATFVNITNGSIYSNTTTSTVNLTSTPSKINNYRFRCKVTSTCSTVYSSSALLSLNTCAPKLASTISSFVNVQAYPNPFDEEINVSTTGFDGPVSVSLKDLNGTIISIQENIHSDDLITIGKDISAGIYILEIKNEEIVKTIKVVKTK